eukprot:GFYU01008583.1.p1 GENE.GFYU01008583.1~~GFYU01008583.1.p1  ORF type:complete len:171 (-),score=30.18 GFYU01008583.1:199-663(-)
MTLDTVLSLNNPVFKTYALCVVILALKQTVIAWHTVANMLRYGRGNRAPEDVNKGMCNPDPKGKVQLEPFEPTDRLRRMMHHDIENNVTFFIVGLLYVLLQAGPVWPIQVYTGSKVIHHFVYLLGMSHEARATAWTITNMSFLYMCYLLIGLVW